MLGSWLGSSWFLLGSTLRDPQKQRFRFGGVEKMLGSWLGSTWFPLGPLAGWLAARCLVGWLAGWLGSVVMLPVGKALFEGVCASPGTRLFPGL